MSRDASAAAGASNQINTLRVLGRDPRTIFLVAVRYAMHVQFVLRPLMVLVLSGLLGVAVLSACDTQSVIVVEPTPTVARPPDLSWNGTVGAIFFNKCKSCHGGLAGLTLTSYKDAMKGSMRGPVIVPGNPAGSKLVVKQSAGNHPGQLSDDQLARVKAWIAWGAPEN